ncbi:2-C-methyl-D-erythritol 2,4-cyclodiphosphate synthase [Solimonas sp. C16B3]|uniref:2-C-methyl-D-erythritol 2,4-cyclodiphosphate synthase n=1 Tax=Solimonas marina TaxID=2714601 RepID=A0A969WFQ9_9GAMM|nr:2-C-methyl-D-erythritol 2,4-cyclodiphosphate synthase [Solimonas marina]
MRIGHGFDSHRLEAGDGVQLGGVHIPCAYRIVAHSDGDAIIHALCDALLGAIRGGDIGKLFPDNDPQFKGIDSRRLLDEVMRRVRAAGYQVVNADLTLIAQAPRVSAHTAAMCEQLAAGLGVAVEDVNVKATTNEGMDAIGRKEGLAAHAVVLLSAT